MNRMLNLDDLIFDKPEGLSNQFEIREEIKFPFETPEEIKFSLEQSEALNLSPLWKQLVLIWIFEKLIALIKLWEICWKKREWSCWIFNEKQK